MSKPAELKQAGLKATLPRLRILEIFQTTALRHLSAEDVYRALLADRIDIGLATVYRVLSQLEQAGLLKRSNIQPDKAIYEIDDGLHHDHLVCLDCGKVEEFKDDGIERRQNEIAQERGFRLQEHALSLYATCTKADCPTRPQRRG